MINDATPATFEEIEYSFLKSLGATDNAAAGWLGNWQVESGFRPTAYNPSEGAIGIAQWEGGRRTALDSLAGAKHLSESDLTAQLAYFAQEIAGPESQAWADAQKASTPAAAAAIVDAEFERSAGTTRGLRISDAQTIYGQIHAGQLLGTSGADAGGTINPVTATNGITNPLSGAAGFFSDLLPWNIGKDIKSVVTTIIAFVLKLAFVGAGLTMILLGVWRASGSQGTPPVPIPEV